MGAKEAWDIKRYYPVTNSEWGQATMKNVNIQNGRREVLKAYLFTLVVGNIDIFVLQVILLTGIINMRVADV